MSFYDHNLSPTGKQAGRPDRPALHSDLGTYGIVENGDVEWVTDEGYSNTVFGRVRAAVDFLDTHPELSVVVDVPGTVHKSPTGTVHARLSKDGLAGRYICRDYGNRLVEMRVR